VDELLEGESLAGALLDQVGLRLLHRDLLGYVGYRLAEFLLEVLDCLDDLGSMAPERAVLVVGIHHATHGVDLPLGGLAEERLE
jgi:hypothetical protein